MTSIFLSYARGDDVDPFDPTTSFVARLHWDLTAHGFEVWFDRMAMPSRGLTFHQEIQDAVAARERLVLIVGPIAALSDYVRQEWQFALHADKAVTPILRQGDYPLVPDELKLLHCEDFRDDAQYHFHLENIVRQLREPVPPLGKLIAVPSLPAHYLARADQLRTLRDTLRADLDRPVVITGAAARVGVHGMGGIGKSVLANALVRDRKVREAFPDGIVWVSVGALPTLVELQRRVLRDLGGDGAFLTEHEGKQKLKEILANRSVLLILDDVWRRSDAAAFDVLGPRCRALITTRDAGLLTSLGGTHHVVELLTDDEALRLLSQAAGIEQQALPGEAVEIVAECGRLPLAVALCGGMLQRGLGWRAVLEQLQQARINRIADHYAVEPQHQSVWNAIHVSVEHLSSVRPPDANRRFLELAVFPADEATPEAAIATLWQHTGSLDGFDATELLTTLAERSLIELSSMPTPSGAAAGRRVGLHDLVYDYVRWAVGDVQPLHAQWLSAYQAKCPHGWPSGPNDGYFFTHLRKHLIAAGRAGELADLLRDLNWLEAKNEAGLTFNLTADFRDALDSLPADDSRHKILRLLDEALRRDIHFIARHSQDYPQALFQCLWNTCWWYDSPQAAKHYEGAEGRTGACPPWDQPGDKLYWLLDRWRRSKDSLTTGSDWIRSLRPPPVALGGDQVAILSGHGDSVNSAALSHDGKLVVSSSGDKTIRIWSLINGMEVYCLRGHSDEVTDVAFSPDDKRVVSASRDGTVRTWDVENACEQMCLQRHTSWVGCVAWTPDGKLIASAGSTPSDNTIRLWDAQTGDEQLCLVPFRNGVSSIAISPDSRRLATSSAMDRAICVFDLHSLVENWRCESDHFASVVWSPDGRWIAAACHYGEVRLFDSQSGKEIRCFEGHEGTDYVTSVSFSPDCLYLASGSDDYTIRLWDVRSGNQLNCLRGHRSGVNSVVYSPDGNRIVSAGGYDKSVRIWKIGSDRQLSHLDDHASVVWCVRYSGNGRYIASGGADNTVRIWDALDGRSLHCLKGHNGIVTSLAFSPDGKRIVSGAQDWTGRVWDVEKGRCLELLRGHKSEVWGVAYSPDGHWIATCSPDMTIRIWDANKGREKRCLKGHDGSVRSVAFSPDGRRIASAGDVTVRLWNAKTGGQLQSLTVHDQGVTDVVWSDNGLRLYSRSFDETVRVWDSKTGECLEVIEGVHDITALARWCNLQVAAGDLETTFQHSISTLPVGWFPAALRAVAAHPDGPMWAGGEGDHLCILQLVGKVAYEGVTKD